MNADDIVQRIRSRLLSTNRCSCDVAGAVRVNRVDLPAEPAAPQPNNRAGGERDVSLGDPSAELRSGTQDERSMLPWLLGGAAVLGAALLLLPRS